MLIGLIMVLLSSTFIKRIISHMFDKLEPFVACERWLMMFQCFWSVFVKQLDFFSEVGMMKRFKHSNIVPLLGVCTRSEPVYAVMEFQLHGE